MGLIECRMFVLCDGASIREGLLGVLGGGISQIMRPEYPAELGVTIALMVELTDFFEPAPELTLRIDFLKADGTDVGITPFELDMTNGTGIPATGDGVYNVPFVLNAEAVPIPAVGSYKFVLSANGSAVSALRLNATDGLASVDASS